ncbi:MULTISPECIES: RHE_PE00001 family protein [unclassified Chelatococcus]|uniref:RHE_PE00001 family protein n=1 Tax=unclassified Chelatococcus TaxID=2638111 RepID=UPI001BCA85B3|nr:MULTISPECIES: RHE_PE00001 family protein [unclassified Chelatococcus]MBS7700857.1 DUF1612 domain-containing protein [Chelatococcus sp. YT9]MBX3555390.1 DUF1612 domain-containing protein [Chelatococcus sp.]
MIRERNVAAPSESLIGPLLLAEDAVARLDERLRASPVREAWISRSHFHEACAARWIVGDLVHLEDLVLNDAAMDIRTPTHELTRASAVLRAHRSIASHPPGWALSSAGLNALSGRNASWLDDEAAESSQRLEEFAGAEPERETERAFAEIDALLARSNRTIANARLPSRGRLSGLADLGLYDSERNDDELLARWRETINLEQPALLAALDAWEAWVDLAPLQTMSWLGPLLVAAVLRAGGKTQHHLACVSLGLRESRRAKGGSTLHGYTMAPPKVAMLNAIKAAAVAGLEEHDRLMLARTQLERFLTNRRSHSRLPGLVDLVLAKPLVTPQLVAKELKVTARGALDLIGALSPTLKEVTGRGRYRAWAVR